MYWSKMYYKDGKRYTSPRDISGTEADSVGISQFLGLRTTYEPRTLLRGVSKVITNNQPVLSHKFPEMLIEQKPKGKFAVLLSGGVDSSVLAKLYDGPDTHFIFVQTLLGVERPFFDMIAKTLKGHIHIVDLTNDELFFQYSKEICCNIREPIGDSAIVAVYAAAKYAKEKLGVYYLVIGEGADEVFGGYWQYETFQSLINTKKQPTVDIAGNAFGVRFNLPPEEFVSLWRFVPVEIADGAVEDYVLKAMSWDYLKGLQNLFFWKNIDGCLLNGITAVLPFFHSNVYWYSQMSIPRNKIVNLDDKLKLKIFLKEFALSVGVPLECVDRVKMGFRCEANTAIINRMIGEIGRNMPLDSSAVFPVWAMKKWYESMGVVVPSLRRMI